MNIRQFFRVRNILIYLVIATLWVAFSSYAALAGPIGTFTIINGRVDVLKYGKGRAVPIKRGDGVFLGDVVRTKSKSKARIVFIDDTVLNLAENSRVEVKDFMFNPEKGRKLNILRSFRGLVRAETPPGAQESKPHLRIETPTSIAAVRGTDFFVLVRGADASSVIVIDGFVGVTNVDPTIVGVAVVGPNQMTTVGADQSPTPPRTVTAGEVSTLVEATAADATLPAEPDAVDDTGGEAVEEGSGSQEGAATSSDEGDGSADGEGSNAETASLTGDGDVTEDDALGFGLPDEPPADDAPLLEPEPIIDLFVPPSGSGPDIDIPGVGGDTTPDTDVEVPLTELEPDILIPEGSTTPININISFD